MKFRTAKAGTGTPWCGNCPWRESSPPTRSAKRNRRRGTTPAESSKTVLRNHIVVAKVPPNAYLVVSMRHPLPPNFPAAVTILRLLRVGWLGLVMATAASAASGPAPREGIQKAVFDELNLARTAPGKYVEYLKDQRSRFKGNLFIGTPGVRMMTHEGVAAVDEAIAALAKQAPVAALKFSEGLALAALDHVQDTGPKGIVSHEGTDGEMSGSRARRYGRVEHGSGECISYGFYEARQIVMALIIDDGVAGRGHRRNIYDGDFRLVGMASGPHKTFKTLCVIDFAVGYQDDPVAIRQRPAK